MTTPEEPSDPEIKYLRHKGQALAYTEEGEGDQAIIAIPGLPGTTRDYR